MLQLAQPFFNRGCSDIREFFFPPARFDPAVQSTVTTVSRGPDATILAFVHHLLFAKMCNEICHGYASDSTRLIGFYCQPPISKCRLRIAFVLYWSSVPTCFFRRTRLPFVNVSHQRKIQTSVPLPLVGTLEKREEPISLGQGGCSNSFNGVEESVSRATPGRRAASSKD